MASYWVKRTPGMTGAGDQVVVRIFARALAEFMSNDKSAVVSQGRTGRPSAVGSSVRRRFRTNASLAVRGVVVVVVAIALDLARALRAPSPSPARLRAPPS